MEVTEKERLQHCYLELYRCMVEKDIEGLKKILDDTFVLVHMTGMRQNKEEFLSYISSGRLRYYSEQLEHIFFEDDIQPILIGQSRVDASVFGGGRHSWSLQLTMKMIKNNDQWLITEAVASTY